MSPSDRRDTARRYLVVIQDERGYPAPGELEPAPPDWPTPPVIHEVVLAEDYDRLLQLVADFLRRVDELETALRDALAEGFSPHA